MDNSLKTILTLGLAGLTGAAIHEKVQERHKREDRLRKRMDDLADRVLEQEEELNRLRNNVRKKDD